MSLYRPPLTELISRISSDIVSRLSGADSLLRRSVLWVLARVVAGVAHGLYGYIDSQSRFLPDVAERDRLVRWASIFGLTRKAAVAASGTATVTGSNDIVIEADTVLIRADGARYIVTADATIAAGTAAVAIAAEGAGVGGAMATGQLLTFLSPVAGVQAIATVAAPGLADGADEESDDALRARLLLRIRNPVRCGARTDYLVWALEVAGVTRAWVYESWNGLGTVKLLFVIDGRADIIPDSGEVAAVAAYIDDRRPVCADVTVAGPIADALAMTIALTPDTTEGRAAVTASLADLLAREAEPGGTTLISHLREAISTAAGETDHVLTVPSANVVSAAGHIAVLGTITWA